MAYETPLTIADVISDITSNRYVLPSIQREYVWNTSQIEQLFDSLMQEYPIGAFLFWDISKEKYNDYAFYYFLRDYHEKNNRHNEKARLNGSDNVVAVLDGQQRLTSLYVGLKGSYAYKTLHKRWNSEDAFPKRKLYLNIVEPETDGTNKYKFSFLTTEEAVNDENAYWFEVGKILDLINISDVTKYVNKNIYKNNIYNEYQDDFAMDCLSQLHKVIHTQPSISYYKEKSEELDKVLNIFIRVNSGGTILSYSDLLLSIASAQWGQYDAREEITEFVENINEIGNGFNINKDFVLKTALVLSDFGDIAFKVDNFKRENMEKIESNWPDIKKAIQQAFILVSSFGYSRETLSSNNAVIPIAYYLMTIGLPENFSVSSNTRENRNKIKIWLIRSLLKRAFSGTPDNILRPIRDIIRKNGTNDFPLYEIIEHFKGNSKSIVFTNDDIDEYLLKLQYGKSETLSTLMLLYPSLDFNNKFHVDHMYPKSKFKKRMLKSKGVSDEKIDKYMELVNNIGNLQLLAAIPNIEKQDKDFDEWFNETCYDENYKNHYRAIHYLPDIEYSYDNFLSFVEQRQELMKRKLEEILSVSIAPSINVSLNEQIDNVLYENNVDEYGVVRTVEDNSDKIIGEIVIHNVFGEGMIKSYTEKYITVSFANGDKTFNYPDAFKKYLKAKSPDFQRKLVEGIALI